MKSYLKQKRFDALQSKLRQAPPKPLYVRPTLFINHERIDHSFSFMHLYRGAKTIDTRQLHPIVQNQLLRCLKHSVTDFRIELEVV